MRKFQFYILFFITSSFIKGQNIDSLQRYYFDKADFVALGEVKELDTINLISTFKVFETFKGNSSKIIKFVIHGGYSYVPEPAGLWLIYATKISDDIYTLNDNWISRSNLYPERIDIYVPKPAMTKKEINEFETLCLKIKIKALAEWYNELYKLRIKLAEN